MARTLLDKVWDAHTVRTLPSGQTQLLIGLHLIHEVTTPQAFQMLKRREAEGPDARAHLRAPSITSSPPTDQARPYADPLAEEMAVAHDTATCKDFGVPLFDMATGKQGIVHVIGPELGLTQPGMTIACGDSHTSTHGAVGAIAFGIGTTQVRDVLATQCLAMAKPKLRQVRVDGHAGPGVYAKDVILAIIHQLGVKGGVGYAYEYAGDVDRPHDDGGAPHRSATCPSRAARASATSIPTRRPSTICAAGRTRRRARRSTGRSAWWKSIATDAGAPRSTT